MPKAARISAPVRQAIAAPKKSEAHPLVSIGLFCGIGLLVSLTAILMGVQGAWY